MANRKLVDAFNECVDRLQTNQPVNYSDYPEYEAQLELMVAVGQAIGQMVGSAEEVHHAQSRARARLEQELSTLSIKRRSGGIWLLFVVAAISLLVLTLVLGGIGVWLAQSSLPSDRLYDLKLLTEDVRLWLSTDDAALEREFAQRRLDETHTLLDRGREEHVAFEGVVQAISADTIQVSDLILEVSSLPDLPPISPESRIQVTARTTKAGQLVAESVTVLDESPTIPVPVPTVTPSVVPTISIEPAEEMIWTPEPTPIGNGDDLPETAPTAPPVIASVSGGAGCTPGFWRQENHFEFWVGFSPSDSASAILDRDVGTMTLEEAVWAQGGGLNALLRHTTAALLNAAHPGVTYAYSTSDVLVMFRTAYDKGDYEVVKDSFDVANNVGCPLGKVNDKDTGPPDHAKRPEQPGRPDNVPGGGPPSDKPGAK